MKYPSLILVLCLTACGGSGGGYADVKPPDVAEPAKPVVDAFFAAVLALIGDASESSAEPVAIDAIVATAPEDSEPVALQ